ncbi:hypothetical protein PtA15_10A180 [Puccinia triticina]|uniref:Yippee domain-containing protein n=1 Tax=Puccinia triticina TaxID=208348 RepID=A0ABY7CTY6_9BASI|nr:uncharacterized protein PtA15_10A180 [Puccinia triticina]WAQ88761.1 hypothetical protein PtA15_10A180 [Puccinia triticina]
MCGADREHSPGGAHGDHDGQAAVPKAQPITSSQSDHKQPAPSSSLAWTRRRVHLSSSSSIWPHLEGEEESLIGDDDGLQHDLFRPSSPTHDSHTPRHQAPDPAALLPVQLQKILADPGAYFYRCDLCISRLALKPGALPQTRPHPRHAFQFRAIDQHAGLASNFLIKIL